VWWTWLCFAFAFGKSKWDLLGGVAFIKDGLGKMVFMSKRKTGTRRREWHGSRELGHRRSTTSIQLIDNMHFLCMVHNDHQPLKPHEHPDSLLCGTFAIFRGRRSAWLVCDRTSMREEQDLDSYG
jgi:hypothetical protein